MSGKKCFRVIRKNGTGRPTFDGVSRRITRKIHDNTAFSSIHQDTRIAQQADKIAPYTKNGVIAGVKATEDAMMLTNEISERIGIVSETASQTNLLALHEPDEVGEALIS